jgi:hypothetical protein
VDSAHRGAVCPRAVQATRSPATLEPVRFGEFLLLRNRISDEQWLAALAEHWSGSTIGRYQRIGATIAARGFLAAEQVEAEARVFHEGIEDLEVIEVEPNVDSTEVATVPPPFRA